MDSMHSLSTLFDNAQCQYRVYDLGRRVTPIERSRFIAIEENRAPYPYPVRNSAKMAVAFWQESKAPWIWFLDMPLDERGLVKQAAMGDFIQFVAQAMGSNLNRTPTEEEQEKLANNPYIFKPTDDKKAMFHARLTTELRLPASQYYDHAQHYMGGTMDWQQWQGVGLQGLADLCARMDRHNNATLIRKALDELPAPPKYALLGCLEHGYVPEKLALKLAGHIESEAASAEPDIFLVSAYLRALSGGPAAILESTIKALLAHPVLNHREILIAIAGRCWRALETPKLVDSYLVAVARQHDQAFFQQIVADLVMLPRLRPQVLNLLHGQASTSLVNAVKQLQKSVKTPQPGTN